MIVKLEENNFLPLKEDWILNPLIHVKEVVNNDQKIRGMFN